MPPREPSYPALERQRNDHAHPRQSSPTDHAAPIPHPPRHKPYRIIYQSDASGGLAAATDVNDYRSGIVGPNTVEISINNGCAQITAIEIHISY